MKDPVRLRDGDGSPLEQLFLRAAMDEQPDSRVEAIMLAPLGLGAVPTTQGLDAAAAQVGAGQAANTTAGVGGSMSVPPATAAAGLPLVKWAGITVVALSTASAGLFLMVQSPSGPKPADHPALMPIESSAHANGAATTPLDEQATTAARSIQGTSTRSGSAEAWFERSAPASDGHGSVSRDGTAETEESNPSRASDNPSRSQVVGETTARAEAKPSSGAQPSLLAADQPQDQEKTSTETAAATSLREEIALLDRARGQLRAGNPTRALQQLSTYDARFPNGVFRQEATVLRMDALRSQGQTENVSEIKEQFLRKHPESAHKARIESDRDGE